MSNTQNITPEDLRIMRAGIVVGVSGEDIHIEFNNGAASSMRTGDLGLNMSMVPDLTKVREYEVVTANPYDGKAIALLYKFMTPYETHIFLLTKAGGLIAVASGPTVPEEYDTIIR